MSHDTELLRRYVEERSESAFTELVHEHMNLVYSAALRETNGDGAQAEDVSQTVFTELARKAPRLLGHPSVAGWLHTTTRLVAANARRAEQRRHRREEKAQSMNEVLSNEAPNEVWQRIRPVLDDALHELKEADREAVLLRFLKDRPLREVGVRLGLNENAARMRVDRALEQLRGLLARRGITSTTSGLATALAVGAVTPVPATLAASVASAALASGAAAGSTILTLLNIMSIAKLKVGVIGALVVAGIAVPLWQQTRLQRMRSENEQLRAQGIAIAALRDEVGRLRKVEADGAELERLRQWQAQTQLQLARLRGMAGLARQANAEAEELRAQLARQQSDAGTNQLNGPLRNVFRRAMEQQVEGRVSRIDARLHLTPEQAQGVREILMREAEGTRDGMKQVFAKKQDAEITKMETGGNAEEEIKALLTPEQQTAFADYQREEFSHYARLGANAELLEIQSTLGLTAEEQDRVFASLYELSFNQMTGSTQQTFGTPVEKVEWLNEQKAKALESVLTETQLEKYRQHQATQLKVVKEIFEKILPASTNR